MIYAASLVGGRWKLVIINQLQTGSMRFSALRRQMPAITERMLTLQLRELEADGLVTRTVFAEVPPRVEYALTRSGTELLPIWLQLHDWGGRHRALREQEVEQVAADQ
ncbi:helix-turn-helix domain-containing protein [Hymenobacter sp. YC55]|uniref:winged helix-turn-helix transcriptional regulator n=1 Tax=Hymenobacter sp. YC55 TaxID=3034019 RepID=UPI0023F819D7|nr:helix-turn-helix domain-containing protein [Hymenobacter sp. YC55]MDF7814023.1 helix-turn-helix domain-containing protein [Hymenobacter sp. YC55]